MYKTFMLYDLLNKYFYKTCAKIIANLLQIFQ